MTKRPTQHAASVAIAILLATVLAACQTSQMARRSFPPEARTALQPGGPHQGTADTLTVIVGYRYHIEEKQPSGRTMQIEGGISRFKMKADSISLHIHFLDTQGETIEQRLIYALGNRQGRDTFIRPSTTFNTTLEVPEETVSFAIASRTRLSRGRR
ncbi:MAG: hypothetical protein QNJ01_17365 [Desulfobacterales bacterium]|nr:hypothetical protein [Desulfobacterales bacterium]